MSRVRLGVVGMNYWGPTLARNFARLPDAELAWLYANAAFTVFPSLMEGWGLPVGESLWFGKPCVASSGSAVPAE